MSIVFFRGFQEHTPLVVSSLLELGSKSKPKDVMQWLRDQGKINSEPSTFVTRHGFIWTDKSRWTLGDLNQSYAQAVDQENACSGNCDDLKRNQFCIFSKSQSMAIAGNKWDNTMPLYMIPPLAILVRHVNHKGQLERIALWNPTEDMLRTRIGFLMSPRAIEDLNIWGKIRQIHQKQSVKPLTHRPRSGKARDKIWKRWAESIVSLPNSIHSYLCAPTSITDLARSPLGEYSSGLKMYLHNSQSYGLPSKNRHLIQLQPQDHTTLQERLQQVVGQSHVLPVLTIQSSGYAQCWQRFQDTMKHTFFLLLLALMTAIVCFVLY